MKSLALLFGFTFLIFQTEAQEYDKVPEPLSIASGEQTVLISTPCNALSNPALMAAAEKSSLGIAVLDHYFLRDLKSGSLGGFLKFGKTNAVGGCMLFEGTPNLRQNFITLGYAKQLTKNFTAGVSFIYINTFEQGVGNKNNMLAKAGLLFRPSKQITLGFTTYNPFSASLRNSLSEKIPSFVAAGLKYAVSSQVDILVEEKLSWSAPQSFKAAIHYKPKPGLAFYLGFQSSGSIFGYGFSYHLKKLKFSFGMQYHQRLGFSSGSGIAL
jgi:hypothetical protein